MMMNQKNCQIGSNDHPTGPVMSDDPDAYSWEPKPPEPVPCPYCGNNQYYAGYYFGGGKVQWYTNTKDAPIPCKCDGMAKHLQDEHDALMRAIEKREQEQQRRENEQLMNTVSGLTNTSYSGVSSPSLDYDKYGDLG